MSNIINKVKDALHSDHSSSTTGTHGTTGTHTTGAHTTGAHTTGAHTTGTHTTGTHSGVAEGVAGPHSSRAANAADPRVDSDLDGSRNLGASTGTTGYGSTGVGHTGTHSGVGHTGTTGTHTGVGHSGVTSTHSGVGHTGTTGTHSGVGHTGTTGTHTGAYSGTGVTGTHNTSTNAGPHDSNIANKLDPRVDSDLDGSRNLGASTGTTGYGSTGVGHTGTHSGVTGTTGTHTGVGHSGVTGTHSGVGHTGTTGTHTGAYDGTHAGNRTGTNTGTHGGISHSTNAGPHDSNLANKADPRVDSDLDGRGNRHGAATGGVLGASGSHATAGSGTAQNTAGPHNSDLLNKIDPRVDSDRDGSKTIGGNKTHASGLEHKDPLDAAQVPPSVLRETLGEPQVLHDHSHNDHSGRHGSVSHQETARGL